MVVVAGSLGAGKTSLLRNLVDDRQGWHCHVIVNELGDVLPGVGDFQVRAESTTVLRGGCACCVRREDLVEDLVRFADEPTRNGRDLVFLELSGVADPAPVIHTLLGQPFLAHHYRLQEVITVVDAVDAAHHGRRDALWTSQVALADRCVLSKADLVSSAALAELQQAVGAINPWAVREVGDHGRVRPRTSGESRAPVAMLAHERGDLEAPASHGVAPEVTLFAVGSDFEWGSFGVWLSLLLHRWGSRVLRIKGVVPSGAGQQVSVNAVHHAVFPPEHVEGEGATTGQLVFITTEMPAELLERSLAAFVGAGR